MSGIALAAAAGVTPSAPPPPPLSASIHWGGADNFAVSGASGSSADMGVYSAPLGGYTYTYYFAVGTDGGTAPVSSDGLNVTYNPSGKLGIVWTGNGGGYWLTWNSLSINETEVITVAHGATDAAGGSANASYTVAVKRMS